MSTAPDPFERVTYHGKPMDQKTKLFLQCMEDRLGYQLTVLQGCYGSVDQSAGTHDGGGVVDLSPYDWQRKVRVAANLGAFVWHRTPLPGEWSEHIHLGIRNQGRLSDAAIAQQHDWDHNPPLDGLADHAPMSGYHPTDLITFHYWAQWDKRNSLAGKARRHARRAAHRARRAAHATRHVAAPAGSAAATGLDVVGRVVKSLPLGPVGTWLEDQRNRALLYRGLLVLGPLLVAVGWLDDKQLAELLGFASQVLGVGAAVRHTYTKKG